jgi:uncharacterized membrane protein
LRHNPKWDILPAVAMKALFLFILIAVVFAGAVLLIQHVSTALGIILILVGASPVLLLLLALVVRKLDKTGGDEGSKQ